MNPDHAIIEQHCVKAIEIAKKVLTLPSPQESEIARDACIEAKSSARNMLDKLENEIDDLRKQKRQIEDRMADLKKEQRPWKAYADDLQELARRCNNHFFDLRREAQSSNVKF